MNCIFSFFMSVFLILRGVVLWSFINFNNILFFATNWWGCAAYLTSFHTIVERGKWPLLLFINTHNLLYKVNIWDEITLFQTGFVFKIPYVFASLSPATEMHNEYFYSSSAILLPSTAKHVLTYSRCKLNVTLWQYRHWQQ